MFKKRDSRRQPIFIWTRAIQSDARSSWPNRSANLFLSNLSKSKWVTDWSRKKNKPFVQWLVIFPPAAVIFLFHKVEIKYRLSMGEQRVGSEWTETSLVCPNSPFFCPRPFFFSFLSLLSLHKHPFPSNWFCGFWRPCMYVHITISNIYRELLARARAPAPHSSSLLKPMLYFSTSFNARLFWCLCLLVLVNSVSCRIHIYCNVAHFSCREKPSGVW